jgi:hypothetical protein
MTIEQLCMLLQTAPVYQRGSLAWIKLDADAGLLEVKETSAFCRELRQRSAGAFEFVVTAGDVALELAGRCVDDGTLVAAILEARRNHSSVHDQIVALQKRFLIIERSGAA